MSEKSLQRTVKANKSQRITVKPWPGYVSPPAAHVDVDSVPFQGTWSEDGADEQVYDICHHRTMALLAPCLKMVSVDVAHVACFKLLVLAVMHVCML